MSKSAYMYCPDCDCATRHTRDEDGDSVFVCTNNECARIVVAVVPAPVVRDPESWQAVAREGRRHA